MNRQWMYQIGGSEYWDGDKYSTREKCIESAMEELKENNFKNEEGDKIEQFEIGQVERVIASGISVDHVLEQVAIDTIDELGDYAEDYLEDVKKEHFEELENVMNRVLYKWMDKHNYNPTFFTIVNMEEVKLKGETINE